MKVGNTTIYDTLSIITDVVPVALPLGGFRLRLSTTSVSLAQYLVCVDECILVITPDPWLMNAIETQDDHHGYRIIII